MNQRWRFGRDSYRPAGEVIRTAEYEVVELPHDTEAKAFVLAHHYSGTYPAARWRFGLFRRGHLVGAAVFSHPAHDAVLTNVFPGQATDSVELGRFVLLDSVPGNGETWFLGRAFELLRAEAVRGVVSFSDPMSRTTAAGVVVHAGHVGTIYQAHNARYLGRATARTLHVLPDGQVFSNRAASKVRRLERGWRYAAAQLVAHGAAELPDGAEPLQAAEWLTTWLPRLTRRVRHHGNHRYAWGLQRAAARALPASLPYPKARAE